MNELHRNEANYARLQLARMATALTQTERQRDEFLAQTESDGAAIQELQLELDRCYRRVEATEARCAELLAALRAMVMSSYPHPADNPAMSEVWALAKAAIAKAEGG